MSVTYRKAGVNIEATDRWLARLKPVIRATQGPEVLPDRGQFASLVRLSHLRLRDPVLVSSTDGVGTKLTLATSAEDYVGIGIDAVAMNVNDVIVYGARPLFFLDYVAVGRVTPALLGGLVRGIAKGCKASGCALVGGETAEMPGVYKNGDYDVAGFCVGAVERRRVIDGAKVRAGDAVIGLASSGVHANGFSLVRKVFSSTELKRLKRTLLQPTRIYVKPILAAAARFPLTAITHITGGGLSRRLPSLTARRRHLTVRWVPGAWPVPPIFRRIQQAGSLSCDEMEATFNMGLGMVLACRPQAARSIIQTMQRWRIPAWVVGTIMEGEG
ncbi:MAG: phosphoribosylformylglycinamidine cyclo-ligase [Candidatus Omnitrophica bacterium]|nr:phosphoribosylformylglycinamidine cyclo-ligase [Candidatus Omnitrophota bacterium]